MIGNEHEGSRPVTRKLFDLHVRIPMVNEFDSLNAAVAAALLLYSPSLRSPSENASA